jgi:hypothetical protein
MYTGEDDLLGEGHLNQAPTMKSRPLAYQKAASQ